MRRAALIFPFLAFIFLLTPASAEQVWRSRPGTVAHTLSLPDGVPVILDAMTVESVNGHYLFVKDPWSANQTLPIYTHANIDKWWSIEITGTTSTIGGVRIVVADRIRIYLSANGQPFIFMPKGDQPEDWPYMSDAKSTISMMSTNDDPPYPSPAPDDPPPASYPPPSGSISAVKYNGGAANLKNRIVTAVFYVPGTRDVSFFYIEESDRSCGIRVVPDSNYPVNIDIGDVINFSGSVTTNNGEACLNIIGAVTPVNVNTPPVAVGTSLRTLAATSFRSLNTPVQPALYSDIRLADPAKEGLNIVGKKVRVWGNITQIIDGNSCRIDDGSGLITTTEQNNDEPISGVKLIFAGGLPSDYTQDSFINGITGIAGAELIDNKPVPVVRIPNHPALRVKPGITQSPDGLSWGNAYNNIQDAINAAAISTPKCEVWVAAGTYYLSTSLEMKDGVAVYGGFIGTETSREERNWVSNPTVLDGQNQVGVITAFEAGPATRIDGFTITNGRNWFGAGIYCDSSPITITNNIITGNIATEIDMGLMTIDPQMYAGSGICCNESNCLISNNTIIKNGARLETNGILTDYSSYGAGIYLQSSSPAILNNVIAMNCCDYEGGGIYCDVYSAPVIARNLISNNKVLGSSYASYLDGYVPSGCGGGIYTCSNYISPICNNIIVANAVSRFGGGICNQGNSTLSNNTIIANSAINGGGVYSFGACTLANNIIAYNSTGISKFFDTTITLHNNCVYGNGVGSEDNYQDFSPPYGNTDINIDPGLVSHNFGNFHIQAGSACINAGNNQYAPDLCDYDFQERKQASPNDTNEIVDIGAYETSTAGKQWNTSPLIIFVKPDGDDLNNGLSWQSAKRSPQAAVDALRFIGGQVWVKAGIYNENSTDETRTIEVPSFVYMYGGFAGDENNISARHGGQSILDGNNTRTVIEIASGWRANTLDNLTIQHGNGSYFGDGKNGGGIYCSGSAPVLTNDIFLNNTAEYEGGALFCSLGPDLLISGCEFTNNSAGNHGGAIALEVCTNAQVNGSRFTSNSQTGTGGAGGGAIQGLATEISIRDCIFDNNTAICTGSDYSSGGGAILIRSHGSFEVGLGIDAPRLVLEHNTFTGNSIIANGGVCDAEGGAVFCKYPRNATITRNIFINNDGYDHGGALALHGSSQNPVNPLLIANNLFVGNHVIGYENRGGGAIHSFMCKTNIINNTFVMNRCGTGTWPSDFIPTESQPYPPTFTPLEFGGAIHIRGWSLSTPWAENTLINNIFYGNAAQYGSSIAITESGWASINYCNAYPETQPIYSYYVELEGAGVPSRMDLLGNLYSTDPIFCGLNQQPDHPYWLRGDSPVRNIGLSPNDYNMVPTIDLDGRPRPGAGSDISTDLGSYEDNPQ